MIKEKYKELQKIWHKENPWAHHCYSAKTRCTNPNVKDYSRYGGKGIKFLMTVSDFRYFRPCPRPVRTLRLFDFRYYFPVP